MTIQFPCMSPRMVARDRLRANHWNPNSVPDEKMELLRESIVSNGWVFPIVTIYDEADDVYVVIDGFHRWLMAQPEWLDLPEVPIVVLNHNISQQMICTIQMNKARGVHQVDLDAEVVRALIGQGLTDEDVAGRLGLDIEAVHRYKQLTGVAELFRNADWSLAWEMVEDGHQ